MSGPELKVVGKIEPPEYKDPVRMLHNIAEDIEKGVYGEVHTIAIALNAEGGLEIFSGGTECALHTSAYVFGVAHTRLLNLPWGGRR